MDKQIKHTGDFGEAFEKIMQELGMSTYKFQKILKGKGTGNDYSRFKKLKNITDTREKQLLEKLGIKIETTYTVTLNDETIKKIQEFEDRDNYVSYK